jgi:VWFA-related protein
MATNRNLVYCLVLAGFALSAQSPSPAGAPEPMRLVRLSVEAVDDQGKPVADLSADDFRVTDQGKQQRIVLFRRAATAAPGPNEFSNRLSTVRRPVTVLLLDLLNEGQSEHMRSVREVSRALQELGSGDSLYLYLLTMEGVLEPIRPISAAPADSQWHKQADSLLEQARKAAGRTRPRGFTQENRVKKTYVALEALSSQLAVFPGRRNIVWVTNDMPTIWPSSATSSGGTPNDSYSTPMGGLAQRTAWAEGNSRCTSEWMECSLYLPHLTVKIEQANVAVYPVSCAGALDPNIARVMEEFANMTGGRSFVSKAVGVALQQAADDARGGYSIAYAPPQQSWDSKFHKVAVTCIRRGVRIQTQRRYYALPDSRPADAKEQAALATTFAKPFDVDDVRLRATVARAADQQAVRLTIRVNAEDVVLAQQGDHFGGQVTVAWVNYGAAGPVGSPGMARFVLQLTTAQREAVAKEGIPIVQDVAIDDSVQRIRLFVVDLSTDLAGSLTIPVPPKS